MKELEKTYSPGEIESRLYQKWLDKKYFHADAEEGRRKGKKPFTIVMPPPNVTGQLHMGHALDNTMQDILIRYKRMQGFEALWQPGTDHAAIATEVKVINKLKDEGIDKHDLGREGFLKEAWKWKEEYENRIISQMYKMGVSADWDRMRFTMDEGCSRAVQEVFIKLYEKGYIYKGSRIINWCPVCQTSISDAEVIHEEQNGFFWHINYPIVGEEGRFVEIATTRPETMLGDTAVAVNPDDERYKDLIGKMLKLPLTDREIPVIADEYVDKEFGTGCVKITPAHDPNDFEVGRRYNLPEICMMNDDATISVPGKYFGMDRYEARKAMVEDLKEQGLLVKVVPHAHNVGTHDRCKTTVEPMVKQQWFVKMEEMAKPAIEALKNGDLKFVPENFGKTYLHWLEGIKDWCISRQLWWGHRIPAYYCDDCGEMVVSREMPEKCPKCGCTHLTQDEDTLDTWFSSALWPFSTLGWPDQTPEMEYFYPTNVLVTGYDIIFFWVVRMVFSALEQTGTVPFDTVLIHGLLRDSQGRKMSKSLGNGIDPVDVIDQYGTDALRFTLLTGNSPGNDMRYSDEKVAASRNFANKIWNAARFIHMNIDGHEVPCALPETLTLEDQWIVSRYNTIVKEVTENLEKFELGTAVSKLYDFLWDDFCDWYIELAKIRMNGEDDASAQGARQVLVWTLSNTLKLLHPFMPFITEEIWQSLPHEGEALIVAQWPEFEEARCFPRAEEELRSVMELITAVRTRRSEMNVPPSKKAHLYIETNVPAAFETEREAIARLAYCSGVEIGEGFQVADAVTVVTAACKGYLPMDDLVDKAAETARLKKELEGAKKQLATAQAKLQNEKFMGKAPQNVIDGVKDNAAKLAEKVRLIEESLKALG